jgi:hypothetical protein
MRVSALKTLIRKGDGGGFNRQLLRLSVLSLLSLSLYQSLDFAVQRSLPALSNVLSITFTNSP